jgi:hypothetical protein
VKTCEVSECSGDGNDLDPKTGLCGFLPEDWYDQYKKVHEERPQRPLFDARCLVLGPPTDDVAPECRALLRLQQCRTVVQVEQIWKQAVNPMRAFRPLVEALALGKYYDDMRNDPRDDLFNAITDNIRPPTFVFKCRFLRARPFRMCPDLSPVFKKGDEFYPGHPSYPSGHATQAYTWAYLLNAKLGARHQYLSGGVLNAAKGVAENREWAGFHYASDTRAGEALGKQIAEAIVREGGLSADEFELLMPGLT